MFEMAFFYGDYSMLPNFAPLDLPENDEAMSIPLEFD